MIKKRNGLIELWRFLACISIAIYHFELIYLGESIYFSHFYIWVEFYFILSGFFLALNADRNRDNISPMGYMLNEAKNYIQYILLHSFFVFWLRTYAHKRL